MVYEAFWIIFGDLIDIYILKYSEQMKYFLLYQIICISTDHLIDSKPYMYLIQFKNVYIKQ